MSVTNPSPQRRPGGSRPDAIAGLRRDDRFVRRVGLQWRRLTGESSAPTMLACSGGADSSALVLALALATRGLVIAHVLHDLRPKGEAEADRDAARSLAAAVGLPFVEAEVLVAPLAGNQEANARRARYAALADLARRSGCRFVATAHHADDQLETILMALMRGSGPRGLRGIAPRRALSAPVGGEPIMLIRPMLHATRQEARDACIAARVAWREDATNQDRSRLRAALRGDIMPRLKALRPELPRRAAGTAELLRDACLIVDERVNSVFGDGSAWDRGTLRGETALVIGEGLRRGASRLLSGRHADRLTSRLVHDAVRAIRDDSTEPREFHWPGGLVVRVESRRVEMGER